MSIDIIRSYSCSGGLTADMCGVVDDGNFDVQDVGIGAADGSLVEHCMISEFVRGVTFLFPAGWLMS